MRRGIASIGLPWFRLTGRDDDGERRGHTGNPLSVIGARAPESGPTGPGPWAGNPVDTPKLGTGLDVVGATVVDTRDYPLVGAGVDVVGATVVDTRDYPLVGAGLDVISS